MNCIPKGFIFLSLLLLSLAGFTQNGKITGVVSESLTGETLIGANIKVGADKGTVADIEGKFSIEVPAGEYTVTASFVGYLPLEQKVNVSEGKTFNIQFKLKPTTLQEVEVIGDVAKTRETPVAFSTLTSRQISEELASRDLPMLLNKTPGVYATQTGGGEGDARINIRGFNQRNVAVMVDGVPMNDMENGWVYWSNWSGADQVTRQVQVQRGLGASKLALPSVGGTINIITKGIESKKGVSFKQEFTNNDDFTGGRNNIRTLLSLTTGKMKKGWGITVAGSHKRGQGWADHTAMRMFSWFGKIEKQTGAHLTTLSGFGAPQRHEQRTTRFPMATYSHETALKYGVDTTGFIQRGFRFNDGWGYLKRYEGAADSGSTKSEEVSARMNYFHKPVFSLKDFWTFSERLHWSNLVYASFGNGGGTAPININNTADGQLNLQAAYNANKYTADDINGYRESRGWIRTSENTHAWYGFLSTLSYAVKKNLLFSGGMDLRTYKGGHTQRVYDLLGGEFVRNSADKNSGSTKFEGDIAGRNFDSRIRWAGLFMLAELTTGKLKTFVNISGIYTGYSREDKLRRKDILLDDKIYGEAVGNGDKLFVSGDDTMTYHVSTGQSLSSMHESGDTVFVVRYAANNPNEKDTAFLINPVTYTNESSESRFARTPWKWIMGYTAKAGANYNFSNKLNAFVNGGILSRPSRFDNVFSFSNTLLSSQKNEQIISAEMGISWGDKIKDLTLNSYHTWWNNKPVDRAFTYVDPKGNEYSANVNGINAVHKGIELEGSYALFKWFTAEAAASVGEWRWTSEASAYFYDDAGNLLDSTTFDPTGVRVGDAAQVTYSASVRLQPYKGFFIKPSWSYFGTQYSNFNPQSLQWANERRSPWQMPDYYLVDCFLGYNFKFQGIRFGLNAAILNVFDQMVITDAENNWTGTFFDAQSAGVFFGPGRRISFGLTASF